MGAASGAVGDGIERAMRLALGLLQCPLNLLVGRHGIEPVVQLPSGWRTFHTRIVPTSRCGGTCPNFATQAWPLWDKPPLHWSYALSDERPD